MNSPKLPSEPIKNKEHYLTDFYDTVFENMGGVRGVAVEGLKFKDKNYIVTINKNAVGKVISDTNLSAEKLAIFDILDDVVENGEYVGSGNYVQHGGKAKNVARYDYFETQINIDGKPYVVSFDVSVFPNQNNYRMHKVINEINLTQIPSADTGKGPAANSNALDLSTPNIPQPENLVNGGEVADNANAQAPLPSERGSATAQELSEYKKVLGLDPRTELEKVQDSEKARLEGARELARLKIVSGEELDKVIKNSAEKVSEAQARQINFDHQMVDRESGRVRSAALEGGHKEVVEYAERLATAKGLKVKYFNAPQESFGNGVIKGDTIYINTADPNTIFTTAVHETLHALKGENIERYNKFLAAVLQYAGANQKMNVIAAQAAEVYADPNSIAYETMLDENGDFSEEALNEEIAFKLAEDIVRDLDDFVEMVEDDGGFIEMLLDFIRMIKNSISKVINGANRENALLDEAERTLIEFMRGDVGEVAGARFSVKTDEQGKYIKVDTDQEIFKGLMPTEYNKMAKMYINEYLLGKTSLGKNDTVIISSISANKYTNPGKHQGYFSEKMKLSTELTNALKIAQNMSVAPATKPNSTYSSYEYYDVKFEIDGIMFNANINIGVDKNGTKHFYEINKIHPASGISQINANRLPSKMYLNTSKTQNSKKSNSQNLPLNATKDTQKSIGNKKAEAKPSGKLSLDVTSRPSNGTGELSVSEYTSQLASVANGRTTKSVKLQKQYENVFVDKVSDIFSVSNFDKQLVLRDMIKEMSESVKDAGYVTDSELNDLFETAYSKGIQVNGEMYEEYKGLKDDIVVINKLLAGMMEIKDVIQNKSIFNNKGTPDFSGVPFIMIFNRACH